MSRTIKTVQRPFEHIFNEDKDEAPDFKGNRPCRWLSASGRRCGLFEANSVHVSSADLVAGLPPVPPEAQEIDARILGEA